MEKDFIWFYLDSTMAQSTNSTSANSQPNRRTKIGLIFAAISVSLGFLGDVFNVWEFVEDRWPKATQEEIQEQPPRGVL